MAAGSDEQQVYCSDRTRVTRTAQHPQWGAPVVVKHRSGRDGQDRTRHEATLLQQLAGVPGVPRLLSDVTDPDLVVEDVAGAALADLVCAPEDGAGAPWRFAELLELAIALATVIGEVHRRGVIHGDITPANIVLHGPQRSPMLIDFEFAATLDDEQSRFADAGAIMGTLAYMAPEQTGRTGRPIDQRTDLYALGATLYELASGHPPFGRGEEGALTLIHDHLARQPAPLSIVCPDLPVTFSDVVARLLDKEPEGRYQSAEGLTHDLRLIQAQLRGGVEAGGSEPGSPASGVPGPPMRLGTRDFPLRFRAPKRLVARDAETAALTAAFDEAVAGRGRGVLVAGPAGVGKTALVDELRPVAASAAGWFITTTIEQDGAEQRLDPAMQAIRALARVMLGESETELATYRELLLATLGDRAGLLAGVLPEFELLLAVPAEPATGDPVQVQARVVQAARDVLRAATATGHPLVLVLDGLQWASAFTLELIDAVLTGEPLPGLLLACSVRDDEVDQAHPLATMQSRWERLAVAPARIRVENLSRADLGSLLAEVLRMDPAQAAAMADPVADHTAGNPYETIELLNGLRQDAALVPGSDGWTWDGEQIRRYVGRGEGAELLTQRIERLPEPAAVVLEVLACLGGEVTLALLAAATALPAQTLHQRLSPSLTDGLLVSGASGDLDGGDALRLRHDRVRQAVLERLGDPTRRARHLEIARRLAALPGQSSVAAEQYLSAVDLVSDRRECRQVVALFRDAAAQLRVTSPAAAERYLRAASELLAAGQEADETVAADQELALQLQIARHAALYSLGQFEAADLLYASVETWATDTMDVFDAGCVQIASLTNRARPREAVVLGLQLLERLGFVVPPADQLPAVVGQDLEQLYSWIDQDSRVVDLERPEIDDQQVLSAARVIENLMAPAFFCDQDVMAWLVLQSRRLWADHGPCRHLVSPLAHAAVVTIGLRQDFWAGYQVVRRVLDASIERAYEPETSRARFLFSVSASHWFEPLESSLAEAALARDGLWHGGDSQTAVFTYHCSTATHLDTARTLDEYLATVEAGLALATRTGNDQTLETGIPYRRLVSTLRGGPDGDGGSAGEGLADDEPAAGPDFNPMAAVNAEVTLALAAALFGDHEALVRHARTAMPLLPFLQGHYAMARIYLLQALSLAQQVRRGGPEQSPELRAERLAELDECRAWLAARARDSAESFGHLLSLVDAQRAWAVGDSLAARTGFDRALQQVGIDHRPWHRAYILEQTGLFAVSQGHEYLGGILLDLAVKAYGSWGARAKVDQLLHDYPFLRGVDASNGLGAARSSVVGISADTLDLMSVLKASQALSSETDLDRLRVRVVDVLTAMTGATAVTVLLKSQDGAAWELLTAAAGTAAPPQGGDVSSMVPLSAVRYAERTREPVVVADATRDHRFSADPYLAGTGAGSLLVVPIMSAGSPRVMLVLENRLHRGVFSADRLDAVMLIAGQLAVSFDTAVARRMLEQEADRRLQLLSTLRERERLLETLLGIQRDISHRAPLQQVLDSVTAGASALLDGDYVALVLADPTSSSLPQIPSVSGRSAGPEQDALVLSVAEQAMTEDTMVIRPGQRWDDDLEGNRSGVVALTAAPVHVSGEIIGSLVTGTDDDDAALAERQDLLAAFAEQVSLALNDATTLKAIRAASLDSLTGLASRPLFLNRLETAMKDARTEVSVLFIDLDRFKQVNDSLGHGAGDELLAGVAERIRGCIRDADTAARFGGDEFAVLLEGTQGPAAGLRVAEALTASLLKPFRIAGKEIFVTASVGVAVGSGDGAGDVPLAAAELLKQADLAMYRAKRERSRRPVLFEPQMHEDVAKRLDLEGDLERAVMAEQLWLQFQPQVLVDGGRAIGVEALVRWTHPEQGPISPATFIPIAEDTGVVVELGRWVLRDACRQVARWRRELHPELGVSVNISGRQLTDGRLAADVAAVLAETGLDPAALTLELTESVLMEDPVESLARLQELKRLGVLVSLDDFGTGYSSLSYLHRFPVDELKIDKSFIDKIATTEADLAIVRAVVELARILQLRVTAEGVETQEQADLLAGLGCEVGQGYLFARPLSSADVPAYLARNLIPQQAQHQPASGRRLPLPGGVS